MNIRFHEIFIHSFINICCLHSVVNIMVQRPQILDVWLAQILGDQNIWVLVILGDVVHIDISCLLNNVIKNIVEWIVEISPGSNSILESSIHDHLFNLGSFLIINKTKIVSIFTDFRENEVRVSESITNTDTFKSFKESSIFLLFFDFLSNGRSILTSITFSEDEEFLIRRNIKLFETSIIGLIEFFKSEVEIFSNLIHWCTVCTLSWSIVGRVSVTETCANGLIHEKNIVLFCPCVLVLHEFVGVLVGGFDMVGTQL